MGKKVSDPQPCLFPLNFLSLLIPGSASRGRWPHGVTSVTVVRNPLRAREIPLVVLHDYLILERKTELLRYLPTIHSISILRIRVHVIRIDMAPLDPVLGLRIQIRIQDSQNSVQKEKKLIF